MKQGLSSSESLLSYELDKGYEIIISRCYDDEETSKYVKKIMEEHLCDPISLETKQPPLVVASDGHIYSLRTIQQLLKCGIVSPYTNTTLRHVVRRSFGAELLAHHFNLIPKCDIATPEWIALPVPKWSGSLLTVELDSKDSIFWAAFCNLVPEARPNEDAAKVKFQIRVQKIDDGFRAFGPSPILGLAKFSEEFTRELGLVHAIKNFEMTVSATYVNNGITSVEDCIVKRLLSAPRKINGMKKSVIVRTLHIQTLRGSQF